jgi:hypothetical protein
MTSWSLTTVRRHSGLARHLMKTITMNVPGTIGPRG